MEREFVINAARSSMVNDLLEAYKRLQSSGVKREECLENLRLTYHPVDGLSIAGAVDNIRVRGYAYDSVDLGSGFEKAVHFPRGFLSRLGLVDESYNKG